ncbi:13982_t:CDS:1, partial [Racocetra fulgida]
RCCGACYNGILNNYNCCQDYATSCRLNQTKSTYQTAYFVYFDWCVKENLPGVTCSRSYANGCVANLLPQDKKP